MITFFITLYRFLRSVWRGSKDKEFRGLLEFAVLILISGTFFYHAAEHWGWLDSLYFSVTTLTTVGYGDLRPTSDISKIFTIVYIFVGLGAILGFINAIAVHARSVREEVSSVAQPKKSKKIVHKK